MAQPNMNASVRWRRFPFLPQPVVLTLRVLRHGMDPRELRARERAKSWLSRRLVSVGGQATELLPWPLQLRDWGDKVPFYAFLHISQLKGTLMLGRPCYPKASRWFPHNHSTTPPAALTHSVTV